MALSKSYIQNTTNIPKVFEKIKDANPPERLTQRLLSDWGFKSQNDRAFIPLLKSLGFLSDGGNPTDRYRRFRDHSRSKAVMAEALREAYSDVFLISADPKPTDKEAIQGKFKSFHDSSDNLASMMTKTFYGLLDLADLQSSEADQENSKTTPLDNSDKIENVPPINLKSRNPEFHYNIQIHLPPTKDQDVYNAIFRSLKEHLID